MMRTIDMSDIKYQRGNVKRKIPMTGQRSLHDYDIRMTCKSIVEEQFQPQLRLQCSREWFKINKNNRKATFKHRIDYGAASMKSGQENFDGEAVDIRQEGLTVIMEEYPPEKAFNFDESMSNA